MYSSFESGKSWRELERLEPKSALSRSRAFSEPKMAQRTQIMQLAQLAQMAQVTQMI